MRIVSLAPSNTEIIYALKADESLVAVTRFCDFPPEASEKVRLGSWLKTDLPKLKELKPDIILTSYFLPEELKDWSGPGKILHLEPKNLFDVFDSIEIIGEALGKQSEAKALVHSMGHSFDELRSLCPTQKPRVYMEEWFSPPMAAGNWIPEIVAIAGGEEVLMETNQPSREFSLPALVVAGPDLVICHWCGWGKRQDEKRILDRPGWQAVPAIANGQVYFVNDSLLNRPGPRLVEGAAALQKVFVNWNVERHFDSV